MGDWFWAGQQRDLGKKWSPWIQGAWPRVPRKILRGRPQDTHIPPTCLYLLSELWAQTLKPIWDSTRAKEQHIRSQILPLPLHSPHTPSLELFCSACQQIFLGHNLDLSSTTNQFLFLCDFCYNNPLLQQQIPHVWFQWAAVEGSQWGKRILETGRNNR